jgi:DMSO/TMAO reductase YedYZ molybdopterin-dependent catalytic subunit
MARLVPLLLAVLAVAFAGCSPRPVGGRLPQVEVREYRGERLGSSTDFRENSIKGPQHVDRSAYRLRVDGAVAEPAVYRYEQVLAEETTYTKVVTLDCVEGWSVKVLMEGVLLSDLVDRARPATDAVTVVFHAVDGYTTSLPLAYVRDRRILLAYRMNGIKWCKWVSRIELSRDPGYRGYWEKRGYSSSGDTSAAPVGP